MEYSAVDSNDVDEQSESAMSTIPITNTGVKPTNNQYNSPNNNQYNNPTSNKQYNDPNNNQYNNPTSNNQYNNPNNNQYNNSTSNNQYNNPNNNQYNNPNNNQYNTSNNNQNSNIQYNNPTSNAGNYFQSPPSSTASYSFYHVEYYAQYFDVDSSQVAQKILASIFPKDKTFLLDSMPDLYGPFWIPTTLICLFFVTSSISNYASGSKNIMLFGLLTSALATIYTYATIVPSILWGLGKYYKFNLSWLQCVNLYGYGLSIWLPVSLLCIIPFDGVRWLIVFAAFAVSAYFMIANVASNVQQSTIKGSATVTLAFMLIAHLALAIVLKTQFFTSIVASVALPGAVTSPIVTNPSPL